MLPDLVSEKELAALAAENRSLVLLFHADWSKPCRLFSPVVEQTAALAPADAVFARMDADSFRAAAAKYGVRSLPTLVIFRDGKPVRRSVGLQTPAGILEQLR